MPKHIPDPELDRRYAEEAERMGEASKLLSHITPRPTRYTAPREHWGIRTSEVHQP